MTKWLSEYFSDVWKAESQNLQKQLIKNIKIYIINDVWELGNVFYNCSGL